MPRYMCQPANKAGEERIIIAARPYHAAVMYRQSTGHRGPVVVIPVKTIDGTHYPRGKGTVIQ